MSSTKKFLFGSAILLGCVRLALALDRHHSPPVMTVYPVDPEAVSQREARKGEQRARLAAILDASELDLEDREKLDEARRDARRVLRDLAHEANVSGARALGTAATDLEEALQRDARRTCSYDALKKLDESSAALAPAARAPLAERLDIVRRHVTRTCELATR